MFFKKEAISTVTDEEIKAAEDTHKRVRQQYREAQMRLQRFLDDIAKKEASHGHGN